VEATASDHGQFSRKTRQHLGPIFHALARQKECQIIEGHLMPDHVHMCIAIPPKHPVASVIGFLKGKSAIAIARLCGKERNFTGEHLWARGYAVSTVGFELLSQPRPKYNAPGSPRATCTAITCRNRRLGQFQQARKVFEQRAKEAH